MYITKLTFSIFSVIYQAGFILITVVIEVRKEIENCNNYPINKSLIWTLHVTQAISVLSHVSKF
jgi:hypothetical protein